LVVLIYTVGNTVPPKGNAPAMQRPNAGKDAEPVAAKPASFDSLFAASVARLPGQDADSVNIIVKQLSAIHATGQMADVLRQLTFIFQRNNEQTMEAYYGAKIAKLENSDKKLTFAGSTLLKLMESEASPSIQLWEAAQAVDYLEGALKINPENEDAQLNLATAYMEGTGEPMKGVQLLLGIVSKKPDDIPANLLLGRMSIKSGQMDKAVGRLQTVLKQDPDNVEALYFMAQVCKEKGEKQKAIELLQKCKRLVNKPEFNKEVDDYINSFK